MKHRATVGKKRTGPPLELEDSEGSFADLITVKTGWRYKSELVEEIRSNLRHWMLNPSFDSIRDKPLDLAIVVRTLPRTMRSQDVDNIAKRVLDAMKEQKGSNDKGFLFRDDSQIVRLLVYKMESEEEPGWKTSSMDISFRVHDSNRQMVLVQPEVI